MPTIFLFDTNSTGFIQNTTATANTGGVNLDVRNGSQVVLNAFSCSGTNTGISTAPGGYVAQKGVGAGIVLNTSTTPFVAGSKQTTATLLSAYTSSYATGTVVYD